MLIVG